MGTSAITVLRRLRVGLPLSKVAIRSVLLVSAAVMLASCASKPPPSKKRSSEYFPESKYGVKASPRVVEYGQPVPQGGGRYMVGKAYKVKGRTYTPKEDKRYKAVGYASWYGSAFHGRYTANGEVYDMDTLSAAHPTMPLPSYARVTNLRNGSSVVVRVNDRGPYERNRVIDLSAKTAELLDVKRHGSAKVKVEYIGPARMEGHDKQMLLASYVGPEGVGGGGGRQPLRDTMFAMRAPTTSPTIVMAMAPIPRARPEIDAGVAIDPYSYEVQAAEAEPIAPPVAVPRVIQASAAGDYPSEGYPAESFQGEGYPAEGTNYGERTLGTFTLSEPLGYAASGAGSSYGDDTAWTRAQWAVDAMARPGNAGLKAALDQAVSRQAAARSADLVEIQVGVYASSANAAAIGTRLGRFGHVRVVEIARGGKSMQAVRLLVDPSIRSEAALQAVAEAGARGAYIVVR